MSKKFEEMTREIATQLAECAEIMMATAISFAVMTRSAKLFTEGKRSQFTGEEGAAMMDPLMGEASVLLEQLLERKGSLEITSADLAHIADHVVENSLVISTYATPDQAN